MVRIVQKENKILRQQAKEVLFKDIGSKKIKKVVADMGIAVASQEDGIAIAAPQVGESLRIFVVSSRIYELTDIKTKDKTKNLVFINPILTKFSKEKKSLEEGCLSVRYLYGKVSRAAKVTLTAYNEAGKKITLGSSGLLAQVFQHEVDHLNGILFIDKAKNVEEISPEEFHEHVKADRV